EYGVSLSHSIKIFLIHVDSDDAGRHASVKVFESVATCDSEDCDRCGLAVAQSFGEKRGESAELVDARRSHMPFVLIERYAEPRGAKGGHLNLHFPKNTNC